MKKILTILTLVMTGCFTNSNAQYYEIANQLPNLISPALSGSMNYKGLVEAHYLKGIGNYNADFLGISTSQGFQYRSWFFMGVGIGVEGVFSHTKDNWGNWDEYPSGPYDNHSSSSSGVMIPIFTDFRFNLGNQKSVSFFIDLKLGCSFLVGKNYVRVNNGYLTNQEYFYLRPSLGLRIPTNVKNNKQAVTIGLNYQLLTANYWYRYNNDVTLNSLGISAAYEW